MQLDKLKHRLRYSAFLDQLKDSRFELLESSL